MTELEMYELWRTLRLRANYNQLNQTIEKNWLSNSFNSHILDLLDKEEIKYRSEKRLIVCYYINTYIGKILRW